MSLGGERCTLRPRRHGGDSAGRAPVRWQSRAGVQAWRHYERRGKKWLVCVARYLLFQRVHVQNCCRSSSLFHHHERRDRILLLGQHVTSRVPSAEDQVSPAWCQTAMLLRRRHATARPAPPSSSSRLPFLFFLPRGIPAMLAHGVLAGCSIAH